ncbi:MAG: hypothetical protein AMJ62_14925 [Myxococcales bacterium SG8_38]|nr:MAG: hypothetical protein AMJ62_14925 [Myxococcales bacterium SG8_38]
MHEDSLWTDVGAFAGPTPNGPRVEYVHILEKGERLTGMAPLYEFLDENTVVSIAFGRDAATLLVIDVSRAPKIIDQVDLPGRGNIWATFTFGPRNSIYIGAYRGFVRFSSQPGVVQTEAP